MMAETDIQPLIEDLEVNIDELESALEALLSHPYSQTVGSLPLLDRAKFYVTSVYAIENLLFNTINLTGVDPQLHPVKTELDRVKQYFEKIKTAETPVTKPNTALDKAAAGRFIKASLAGNDQYDKERAEREAREKAGALLKLETLNRKRKEDHSDSIQPGKKLREDHGQVVKATESDESDDDSAPEHRDLVRKRKSHKPPRTRTETAELLKQGPIPGGKVRRSKSQKKKDKERKARDNK